MARFSERIGEVTKSEALQLNEMNDSLRNSVWNLLYTLYQQGERAYWKMTAKHVAQYFRKVPVDDVPFENYECRQWLRSYFFSLPWYQVYDLIEFIADNHTDMTREPLSGRYGYLDHPADIRQIKETINAILEEELSAYRFIAGVLSPITDAREIEAISNAIESAAKTRLDGAREHLRTALVQLGKKPKPDYRNCIKEAISAVESVAKQITGSKSKGLDAALDELSKATDIHGALKAGFKSLYGYTSDENGIRHAILEVPNVGFAEAKYMLVACSAFVHYLIQKADDAHLLK
jgi:AbiJ N-terminal domain 4